VNDKVPRIHTLRDGGATPATSDCFTPRTMDGNAAEFKGVEYGSAVEGPYHNQSIWVTRAIWAGTVVLAVVAVMLVLAST